MIISQPALSSRLLVDVAPGSVVRVDGEIGFVAVNPARPAVQTLVLYQREFQHFVYAAPDAGAVRLLDFGRDLIVEPDVQSIKEDEAINRDSGPGLFSIENEYHIVAQVGNGDFRLFELSTGTLKSIRRNELLVPIINKWSIGVRNAHGQYIPLIEASPLMGAEIGDNPELR
jgi:hypothetical protein